VISGMGCAGCPVAGGEGRPEVGVSGWTSGRRHGWPCGRVVSEVQWNG